MWYYPQSGETLPVLADGDDVYVAQNVFLDAPINGFDTYGHEVIVAGTVDCAGTAIYLGASYIYNNNSVTVEATGQVSTFGGTAVAMLGDFRQVVNHGLITEQKGKGDLYAGAAVSFGDALGPTSSSLVNTGTSDADGYGVRDSDPEKLVVNNSGTISGGLYSFYAGSHELGQGVDLITNSGSMIGDIALGEGDDLYDGRLGTVQGNVLGEAGNDRLYAGTGNNKLFGGDGTDTLMGGAGADYLSGGKGTDRASYSWATAGVTVGLANPSINKGDAAGDTYNSIENLLGSSFSDMLNGNSASNAINGGSGNDFIKGYLGNDTLTGRADKDSFIFNTALNALTNVDLITDFSVADDTIRLDNHVFAALGTARTLSPAAFRANASGLAADSSDRIIYGTDKGALYYDADGNGAGFSGIRFATVGPGLGLTNADFVVI